MLDGTINTLERVFADHNHDGLNTKSMDAKYINGSGTRSTTGDEQFICGFRPRLIKITAIDDTARNGGTSWGSAISETTNKCLYTTHSALGFIGNLSTAYILWVNEDNTSDRIRAVVSKIDNSSFTLTWSDANIQCSYVWEAFG